MQIDNKGESLNANLFLGLQFRCHHAHARDAHLPAAAGVREGRRHSLHPGHRGRRLQVGALTPKLGADALAPA
jgi:hypothetical protein